MKRQPGGQTCGSQRNVSLRRQHHTCFSYPGNTGSCLESSQPRIFFFKNKKLGLLPWVRTETQALRTGPPYLLFASSQWQLRLRVPATATIFVRNGTAGLGLYLGFATKRRPPDQRRHTCFPPPLNGSFCSGFRHVIPFLFAAGQRAQGRTCGSRRACFFASFFGFPQQHTFFVRGKTTAYLFCSWRNNRKADNQARTGRRNVGREENRTGYKDENRVTKCDSRRNGPIQVVRDVLVFLLHSSGFRNSIPFLFVAEQQKSRRPGTHRATKCGSQRKQSRAQRRKQGDEM